MSDLAPKRQGETVFSLLLFVFSVTAFWQSYTISGFTGLSTAGVFPMLASFTMAVSALCVLMQCLFPPSNRNTDASMHELNQSQSFVERILPLRLVIVVLLITGYVFAMPVFGFLVSSAVFLFLSFSYLWRKSLLVSSLITLASVVSIYFVFRKIFQVVLPRGSFLQGWF